MGFERPSNWVFNPAAAVIAGHLGEEILIYYCVDEYTASRRLVPIARRVGGKALRRADWSSSRLISLQIEGPHQSTHAVVRHGVDFKKSRARSTLKRLSPMRSHTCRAHIGFFGLIADWVDLD